MNVKEAAWSTMNTACSTAGNPEIKPECAEGGDTAAHAFWMLQGIIEGYVEGERAHRWLGYAQGLLVVLSTLTLDEAKEINRAN